MIFLIDADFPDRTKIIETNNWKICPEFDKEGVNVTGYYLMVNKMKIPIPAEFYKKVLNETLGCFYIDQIILCRNGRCKAVRGNKKPN